MVVQGGRAIWLFAAWCTKIPTQDTYVGPGYPTRQAVYSGNDDSAHQVGCTVKLLPPQTDTRDR